MNPTDNARLARELFTPISESFARYNQARLALAAREDNRRREDGLANLRRMAEVKDASARAELQRELASLQRETALDVERSRADRDDRRLESIRLREDQKLAEAEGKALRASVRRAYADYTSAGGEKPLKEFGPEDSPDTFSRLQAEIGEIQRLSMTKRFRLAADMLREREAALESSLSPGEDDLAAARHAAMESIDFTRHKDAYEYYASQLQRKGITTAMAIDATLKRFPEIAPTYTASLTGQLSNLRITKARSPEYSREAQSIAAERAHLTRSAIESPFGVEALSNLRNPDTPPASGGKNAPQLRAGVPPPVAAIPTADFGVSLNTPDEPNDAADAVAGASRADAPAPWKPLALLALNADRVIPAARSVIPKLTSLLTRGGALAAGAVPAVRAGATGYLVGDTINTLPQYFGGRQLTDYGVDAVMGQYGDWIEAANNETEMQISRIEQALASIPQGSRYEAPLRQRLYELQFKLPRAKRPSDADLLNLRPLATASP